MAAPAYKRYEYAPEREQRPQRPPRVRVVPGGGSAPAEKPLSPSVLFMVKAIVICLLVFFAIGVARVSLVNASVSESMETKTINAAIDDARSLGYDLQVSETSLSSPQRIRSLATALDMSSPESITTIYMGPDVVTTDDEGNLSLSLSVQSAING